MADQVTDQIKSLLRGVPDFTLPAYSDQSLWYPDPTLAAGAPTAPALAAAGAPTAVAASWFSC